MAAELLLGLIPMDIFVIIFSLSMPLLLLIIVVIKDARDARKSIVLYLESEKHGYLLDKSVDSGQIQMGKKIFHVDEENPLVVPSGMLVKSQRPFYILKWDKAIPLRILDKGLKVITPENLKSFMENKTLNQLLSPKDSNKMAIVMMIIGVLMGSMAGFIIAKFGLG